MPGVTKIPSMAQMRSVIDKAQKLQETVLFPRWKDVPEVKAAVGRMKDLAKKHKKLTSSGNPEDAVQARKVWESLTTAWWSTLFALLDAQTEPVNGKLPEQLTFDETERLFIDFGVLADGTLPFHDELDPNAVLSSRCAVGIFPCLSFSDYIAECWSMIINGPEILPEAGPAASQRDEMLGRELERAQTQRDDRFREILEEYVPNSPLDLRKTTEDMDNYLLSATKVAIRAPEYREAKEKERQQINQERAAYLDAEKGALLMVSSARTGIEKSLSLTDMEQALSLHERTKMLAKKIVYCQSDEKKIARRVKKIADGCKGIPDSAKRSELRSMLSKKREYFTVPGKTARCDISPFAPANALPIDYHKNALELEDMCGVDIGMFDVPRVRMYGIPRVVFIPAQGLGTFDWSDHTLLLPVFPQGGEDRSLAYALAAFRWDSDEDRKLKNPYEQIKENRKKSLVVMAASFYKDYATWMTKERNGYRLLPRETHKVFAQMFAPKKEEA